MNALLRNSMLAAAMSLGLSFAGTALAQDGCGGKNQPPCKKADCSPGFFKNHVDFWWGIFCDIPSGQCSDLLTALTCKGADATCQRSAAADFLNAQSGCTEDD